jgi:hypothetical protein
VKETSLFLSTNSRLQAWTDLHRLLTETKVGSSSQIVILRGTERREHYVITQERNSD